MTSVTDSQDFDALLDQSSLGSQGARGLRARTPATRAEVVRKIIELRNTTTHSPAASGENDADSNLTARLIRMAKLCMQAGDFNEAERLLRPIADTGHPDAMVKLAIVIEQIGEGGRTTGPRFSPAQDLVRDQLPSSGNTSR